MDIGALREKLGVDERAITEGDLEVVSPIDGSVIASVTSSRANQTATAVGRAREAFAAWRSVPAPRRGELIRLFGQVLRENKDSLGELVTIECGKIREEGLGDVQVMFVMCEFV